VGKGAILREENRKRATRNLAPKAAGGGGGGKGKGRRKRKK
jgi:hypothetical protein